MSELNPSSDGVADITDQLAGAMSEPQQHAIDAHEAEQKPPSGADTFDASIHAVNPDGSPRLKKDGTLARKRGGGSKSKASTLGPDRPRVNMAEMQQVDPTVQATALGVASGNLVIMLGLMIGGADFAPEEKNSLMGIPDRELLSMSFRDYYIATGKQDLPPGLTLCVAIMAYAAPKFSKPSVLERFKKFGGWLKSLRGKK